MKPERHPMDGAVVALIGLPATGKTALALAWAASQPRCLVLHTDLLKVTLRAQGLFPAGPAWTGNLDERLAAIAPWLRHHTDKARADGYNLVVEGTLAIGCDADLTVCLTADETTRRARSVHKPDAARRALTEADLAPLAAALEAARVDWVLSSEASLDALVGALTRRLDARDGVS